MRHMDHESPVISTRVARARPLIAFAISIVSVLIGYCLLGLFVVGAKVFTGLLGLPEWGREWRNAINYFAVAWLGLLRVSLVVLATGLATCSSALARSDPSRRSRASLSGMAARFSIIALIGVGLDAVVVAALIAASRLGLV